MPRVSAGVMPRYGFVGFGIVAQCCIWIGDIALQLRLHALEIRFPFGVQGCVPCWIGLISVFQHRNAFARKRVCAVITVNLGDAETELVILQLLEEVD